MSKKHFEALAAALAVAAPHKVGPFDDHVDRAYRGQWCEDVSAVADVCEKFSPRFDRARFLAACGVEGE